MKVLDEFIGFLSDITNENDDKREKIYHIININGKKKAFGGIQKILNKKNPIDIFDNFSFQNSILKKFMSRLISIQNNIETHSDSFKEDLFKLKKVLDKQKDLIDMIVFCHQGLIGKIITSYTLNDYSKNLSYDELFQSGIFGLYLSIFKYDYSKKNKFTTMSYYWIRYKVSEEINSQNENKTNNKSFTNADLNSVFSHNEEEFIKIDYDNLIEKLHDILSVSELQYLISITSKNNEFKTDEQFKKYENNLKNNKKFQDIIKKSRNKLKID